MLGKGKKTPYEEWVEQEGIPVVTGFHVEDIRTVPLAPWGRLGGFGAFINLEGAGQVNNAYICEIPAGGELKPERHLYEEAMYVMMGRGATTVWNEGGPKQTFEWQAGSLFTIPLNVWHQHFNGSGDEPARFLAMTMAPTVMNLFANLDFVVRNPFTFDDRFSGEDGYFSARGELYQPDDDPVMVWRTNFVPDVLTFDKIFDVRVRGAGAKGIKFAFANDLAAGISEFPVGAYKKAHRHAAGTHIIILSGQGYSLTWQQGKPISRYDWHEGSLIVPPDGWFHQHFNTGAQPARYLKLKPWAGKIRKPRRYQPKVDVKKGGDQIEYEDEDLLVRKMFEAELAKVGVKSRMES